jgi:hypothetical protein
MCREKKQKAVMREKEILCQILTFYPSRIRGSKRHRIPDLQHCLCVQGEEAEGGDAGSRIRILTFYPSRIPDPGAKKAPDPGSRICNTACVCREKKQKAVMRDPGSGS